MTSSNDPYSLLKIDYVDERFDDIYHIYLNRDLSFSYALRYLDSDLRSDPVRYDLLSAINPYHQHEIRTLLWKRQNKKK